MMIATPPIVRAALPKPTDRLRLGHSGLLVSPLCIGLIHEPGIVPAAFDAGVNFFFISADLHWPLYEGVRRGLEMLLDRGGSVRDDIVVSVVSYLDMPMFEALQFHEVIDSVRGLKRVDLLVAGAVWNENNLNARLVPMLTARSSAYLGSRAVGASFHHRRSALAGINSNLIDISYIRYNTAHPGARKDLLPFVRPDKAGLVYNFKSLLSHVTPERFAQMGLHGGWLPSPVDYYRFVLTHPGIDGILCSPATVDQLHEFISALGERPLTQQEQDYMIWLSSAATPKYFEA